MTDRSRRAIQRINYQTLHSIDAKVPVNMETDSTQPIQLLTDSTQPIQPTTGSPKSIQRDPILPSNDSLQHIKPFIGTLHGINNITMLTSEINFSIDEITDIIDEHSITGASLDDTKEVLQELSKYRKELRMQNSTLSALAPDRHAAIEPRIQHAYNLIKDFNIAAHDHKNKSQGQHSIFESKKFEKELDAMLFAADQT